MEYKKKIISLELLRFIAAILVLFHHYIGYQHGFIGVNIFFMISGFVIMYSTSKHTEFFFIRRLIRIIPIYWILTIFFAIILIIFPKLISKSYFDLIFLIKSLLFIPFENLGIGPGIGHSPYIFLGWTLNYEIFFYLFFQIVIFITHKYRGIILVILFMCIHFLLNEFNFENFILKTYASPIIFQFCYGIFVFYLWEFYNRKNKDNIIYFYFFIIFLLFTTYEIKQTLELKNVLRLNYSITSLIIILSFVFVLEKKIKSNYFFVFGAISYPIYLIHPYIKIILDKIIILNNSLGLSAYYLLLLIINFITAWIIYNFYEKKIIRKLNYYFIKK